MSQSLTQSQTNKAIKESQIQYFKDVLKEGGISLRQDNKPNVISQEQAFVIRDILKALKTHITYPNNTKEFLMGLKALCRSKTYFQKALTPTNLEKPNESFNIENSIQQDSLIRLLLNVTCLQDELIDMLLEQATISAAEDNDDTTWLRLVLNPLRYLSHINNANMLTTKLLDILEIATFPAQLEILNLIPEIIPDHECEQIAKQLSKLLEDNNDLIGAITDCLNSLNLSAGIRGEIQALILTKLESISSAQIFPILFEFLTTDCSTRNLQTVLMSARNALDTIMAANNGNKEVESSKVLIFNRLQAFATARKSLHESWINVLTTVQTSVDHKPIDILILFMLHSVGSTRKNAVENFMKKRIKGGYFKISHFENLFHKYLVSQILKDYLNSMLEIASGLLRFSHETILIEFATFIYKTLFSHELIDQTQRQDIIQSLILLIGVSDKRSITPALKVLISLREDFTKLQEHSLQLMSLLEKLDAIDLLDVQLIFDILCSLTCGENANESYSGLKDEIHMIIRKQLSSAKKSLKHRGIIAAVVMAKVLATTSQEQSSVSVDDSISISDLARSNSQEAAALLELANKCTLDNSDSVGLYYDQLASMLSSTLNLDNYLVGWLYQLITNDFQTVFVTESIDKEINDIPISMQYSLNAEEEITAPIAVNIAELTIKKKSALDQTSSISTLAPLFRLLRLVHFRQHSGDLGTIDALLGCAVALPDLENIDNYDTEQIKQVSDCIFHCINWFRELLSAFVTQKSRKLRGKVLERVADIVQLQERLDNCLVNIPEHKLPLSYFDALSQNSKQLSPTKSIKVGRPKKKQKTTQSAIVLNDTTASTSVVTQQTKATTTSKKKGNNKQRETNPDNEIHFREMDTDVVLLLRYPLKISDSDNVDDIFSQATQRSSLNLNQFNFLMKDLVLKLNTLSKNKNYGLCPMSIVKMKDFVTDYVRLLPIIRKQLNVVIANLDKIINEVDGCLDAKQMFTPEVNNLKMSFMLVLNSYALIFGWSGFQHTTNLNLLKDCLKTMKDEQQTQMISTKALIIEFTAKLVSYTDYCLYLSAGVSLVQIMQALYLINSNSEVKKKIAVVSGKLLTKKWYGFNGELEGGKNLHANIDILVKAYLKGITTKTICGLVNTVSAQISELTSKDDSLPMMCSITKANFYIFYRCLCITLLEAVQNEVSSLTNNQHLVLWRTTALTMQGLMNIVKTEETKTNLTSFLKNSIGILKVFLSSGIPIFEIMLRSKPDEVVEIFKIMQSSTRFLHHLCCYSKFTKDASLVAYVPQFRLTLESLLYRVKAALVANNCSAAFWMGTLKNRDLQGQDLLSQSSVQTEESGENQSENEELPADESEEDRSTNKRSESEGDSSASEIF